MKYGNLVLTLTSLILFSTPPVAAGLVEGAPQPKTTHRYTATRSAAVTVYGPAEPVLRVAPGDIVETNTLHSFMDAMDEQGRIESLADPPMIPLTGPFFIEGAEPGDTLSVRILSVEVDSEVGIAGLVPGLAGFLNSTHYTPMLGADLPEKIWYYPIDREKNIATFQASDSNYTVDIPLHPFLGVVATAPAAGEVRVSIVPAEFGGNMDAPQARSGNIVHLPVNVPGALLFLGDGHAAQGDGEVAATAIEVALKVRIQMNLVKNRSIKWPRFENDREIMAVGAYRDLDDALRIALMELIGWIEVDYGLSRLDAYQLLSQVARISIAEVVDPNYVVVARIQKSFLPQKP